MNNQSTGAQILVGIAIVAMASSCWSRGGKSETGKYVRGASNTVSFHLDHVADDSVPFAFDADHPFLFGLGRCQGPANQQGLYIDEGGGVEKSFNGWVFAPKNKDGKATPKHEGAVQLPEGETWQATTAERGTLSPAQRQAIANAIATSRICDFHRAYFPAFGSKTTGWYFEIQQGGKTKKVSLSEHFPLAAQNLAVAVDSILKDVAFQANPTIPEAIEMTKSASYINDFYYQCRKVPPDSALLE